MKRHKVTRRLKSGKTITYWRGKSKKSRPGKEYSDRRGKPEDLHKIAQIAY